MDHSKESVGLLYLFQEVYTTYLIECVYEDQGD